MQEHRIFLYWKFSQRMLKDVRKIKKMIEIVIYFSSVFLFI